MTEDTRSLTDGPLTAENISDEPTSPNLAAEARRPDSRRVRILKTLGWIAFGLFFLVTFTLLKLPEERLKNFVLGTVNAQLAPKGISLTADRGYLSPGWGISYVMRDVTLHLPSDATTKIEKVAFTPSLLPMLLGYQGGNLWVSQGDGTLKASVSIKGTSLSLSFTADQVNLGKIGALPALLGVQGSATATGSGSFSGDMATPSTLSGSLELALSKITLEPQSVAGFAVPRLQVSEGRMELNAEKGKATIKTFRLGKAGNAADDIQANGNGDIVLGRNWDTSTINAKANARLSESLLKAFIFVDAFLGPGKQPDGSYNFTLSGPLTSPQFNPGGS